MMARVWCEHCKVWHEPDHGFLLCQYIPEKTTTPPVAAMADREVKGWTTEQLIEWLSAYGKASPDASTKLFCHATELRLSALASEVERLKGALRRIRDEPEASEWNPGPHEIVKEALGK